MKDKEKINNLLDLALALITKVTITANDLNQAKSLIELAKTLANQKTF